MTRVGSVLFLSAMSVLFREGSPFVLLSSARSSLLGGSALPPPCRCAASARPTQLGRRSRASSMAIEGADVCAGDVPTPGWVRLAQRNLKRVTKGDSIPEVRVRRLDDNGVVRSFSVRELFGDKKAVLVGVPGAFTPTCSQVHLPGFVDKAGELAAKGAELVAFVAVNDVYVMRAWEESQSATGKVLMLSDGNGDLASALGMMVDLTHQGMGLRCKRFVCVVDHGVVTHVSAGDKVDRVSASAVERVLESKNKRGPRKGGLFEKLLGREVEARAAEANSESGGLLPA